MELIHEGEDALFDITEFFFGSGTMAIVNHSIFWFGRMICRVSCPPRVTQSNVDPLGREEERTKNDDGVWKTWKLYINIYN